MNAWIGLGGNHENSGSLISNALSSLNRYDGISLLRQSLIYRSPPWGMEEQPDFVNAAAELDTTLAPADLLAALHAVEGRLGRVREGARWGPRCIDLDLLTYEDLILETEGLVLPHPRLHLRAFALLPILELEPGFVIPGIGAARGALQKLGRQEEERVRPLACNQTDT